MNHSLVAKLLSESLNDFYMEVDPADHHEESNSPSPDLPLEIPDSQSPYEASPLSYTRDCPDESVDSQEVSRDYNLDYDLDYDLSEDFLDVDFGNEVVPFYEVSIDNARLDDNKFNEANVYDLQLEDPAFFETETTQLAEDSTLPTERPIPRFPLHNLGYDINGRLPREARRYQGVMDDEATQSNTQPYHDPRRHGTNSMLCEQDETDIIAILHPTSPSAHRAVSLTADAASQHILQNHPLSQIPEDEDEDVTQLPDANGSARDIALRFSSKVNDVRNGFYFGRNPSNADIILGGKPHKTISSRQFRIFLNHYGILMLEDTSTNGTIVDGIVLRGDRGADLDGNSQPRMTLHQGAMIEVPTTNSMHGESIRFVVNIPSRDVGQTKYNQNLTGYLQCINQAERRAAALEKAGANAADVIPVPTNTLPSGIRQEVTPNTSTYVATTGGNTHGMHWNGGTKYNVVSFLGSGAMAMVFKLSSKRDGEVYACKQLDKKRFLKNGIVGDKVYNELNIMKKLRHPYIVACTDQHETDTYIFIIMELVPHGDLGAYTTAGKLMPEHDAVVVARQMVDALEYLHRSGITHRDIKPENILVAAPYPWIFKLSDFGLAKVVKNDETFLKTFCGTLLYLAPEVYPGYSLVKSGKDPNPKRARDAPPLEPRPYRHSVDIWSLGAVLYQLLAAKPAWSGTSANNGAEFLVTVMTIPVDYERLIMVGNSREAAAFISRMLVLDPRGRARETELKVHPWLVARPTPFDPNVTIDEPVELDASQLSLVDNAVEQDDGLEYDDGDVEDTTADPRDPKRSRSAGWVGEEDEDLADLYGDRGMGPTQNLPRSYFEYDTNQPLPDMSGPPPPRLFGEIGSSALQSSGVLGQNANAALEVAMEGSSDEEYAGGSFRNAVVGVSEHASAGYPNLPHTDANTARQLKAAMTQQNIQYPQTISRPTNYSGDPSLLGAEALVGQLNMASPASAASADSNAASQKTATSLEFSPVLTTSKRPSQVDESIQEESAAKRSRAGRSSSPLWTERRSVDLPANDRSSVPMSSDKTAIDHATALKKDTSAGADAKQTSQDSKRPRGLVEENQPSTSKISNKARADDTIASADSKVPSQSSNSDDHKDGQQSRGNSAAPPANTQRSPHPSATTTTPNPPSTTRPPSIRLPLTPSIDLPPPPIPSADGFIKPSICKFGTLFPTRGSIKTVPKIKLTTMGTTFGRASDNTYIHPNRNEMRVPKGAFDLQLWYPGMEKDLEAGVDWTMNPNLSCFISTRTSRYIKINGVRLMKGKDCWLYGKLRSGDIISVFELAEGQQATCKADNEYLRFSCEFYVGGSRAHRKGDRDRFCVLKEKRKFLGGKSREGSVVGDAGTSASAAATMAVGARSITAGSSSSISGGQNSMAGSPNTPTAGPASTASTTGKQPSATGAS